MPTGLIALSSPIVASAPIVRSQYFGMSIYRYT